MSPRRRRLLLVIAAIVLLALATAFVVSAFRKNLVFFYTPSEVMEGKVPPGSYFRIGGMVEKGSVVKGKDGTSVTFRVTDTAKTMDVSYKGLLPDLFKEGKGVVAQGKLENGVFVASEVLAKHDANYMPPEAKAAVEQAHRTAETLE